MGSKAHTTLADEGTRKGAPTNYFGTPSGTLSSGFRRLCQAPDKIVLFYLLRPATWLPQQAFEALAVSLQAFMVRSRPPCTYAQSSASCAASRTMRPPHPSRRAL